MSGRVRDRVVVATLAFAVYLPTLFCGFAHDEFRRHMRQHCSC